MVTFAGIDPNGVARVFGVGRTDVEAEREARAAAFDYAQSRPDVQNLLDWTFIWRQSECRVN